QFRSDIYLISGNKRVNAKSIMGMMSLGLIAGEDVTVTADGSDEKDAVSKIEKFLTKID
ncbi:MAG: HPr family phosphocarrier protein, partial [Lachnospiraceae bacterium]|nr:HPr family phosphocarrier protein [Lachnospiraceae bacterium]